MKLHLSSQNWSKYKFVNIDLYFRGYLPGKTKSELNSEFFYRIVSLIEDDLESDGIRTKLCSLFEHEIFFCGALVIHIKSSNKIFLCSDLIRSIPLFYSLDSRMALDSISSLNMGNCNLSLRNLEEYVVSGFVYDNSTVLEGIRATRAGEIVELNFTKDLPQIKSSEYFKYEIADVSTSQSIDSEKLDQIFLKVFKRLCSSGKIAGNWIVPLSGGHDSRIIVNYLHKIGVNNVICFSYGTPGNEDAKISEQVASALNFDWHFIEYNEEKWQELHDKKIFNNYMLYGFNGVSTPHLQDFLAIYELKEKGLIKNNDTVIPGHALDFLAGSHFTLKEIEMKYDQIIKMTMNKFVGLIQPHSIYKFRTQLSQRLSKAAIAPFALKEYFNWQERQSKFIVNSLRVYEYFGLDWRLPFWEKEIVSYFQEISPYERVKRRGYLKMESQLLCQELLDIPYKDDSKKPQFKTVVLKKIKKLIPDSLLKFIRKFSDYKPVVASGCNYAFSHNNDVSNILAPIKDFPPNLKPYLTPFIDRKTYQMNFHIMARWFTLRLLKNKQK